jgi:hypothetical protein
VPEQFKRHQDDAARFVELLLQAAQSSPFVRVVGTVRADFYDPLIRDLGSILPAQQVTLTGMSHTELKRTITEPARMVGLSFDLPSLVEQILEDVGSDEGTLPLLQYALKESWRRNNTITADSYTRSGGVRQAISRTAERTFEALSADDQQAARQLFLRLVTPGEGQEDTRARVAMPDEPTLRKIVDRFAGSRTRLLVTGSDRSSRPTVEVAHEALIRTWPRLRKWVDANREKLRARAAIVQAKAVWEEHSRREDLLLPAGFQLERARILAADPGDITIDDIRAFVDESEAADTRRRAEDAERERQRQLAEIEAVKAREQAAIDLAAASRRLARRTLAGLVGALVLAVMAIGIGIYASSQTAEAVRLRAEAEKQASLAEAKTNEAEANFLEGQKTESHFRAEQAKQAGADAVTAALLALEGLPDSTIAVRPFVNEAWHALYGARLKQRERAVLSGPPTGSPARCSRPTAAAS